MSKSSERLVFCGPAAATFLVGPALFAAGILAHPAEPSTAAGLYRVLANHHGQWMLAHWLLAAGAVLTVPYVLLAAYAAAQRGRSTLTGIGAGISILGMIVGVMTFSSSLAIGAAGRVSASSGVRFLDAFLHQGYVGVLSVLAVLAPLGLATVAVGLYRSGAAGRLAALAIGVGPALVVLPEPVPCVGMLLWLAGSIACVRAVASYPATAAVPAPRVAEPVLVG